MTTVLVTGAAGFIGSRLAAYFTDEGAQVLISAKTAAGSARAVLSADTLACTANGTVPDAILHAAGSGTVGQVTADPRTHLPNNLAATLAVLEYARTAAPHARVVLLSSAAVYGDAPAAPQCESDARAPVSLYGLSKAQSEDLMAHYAARHGVQSTAVRLFSVYGPGLRKQLLWDAMRKFAAGRADFFGTGQEQRDWIHVDDVCHFMGSLLAHPPQACYEVFNCGGQPASTHAVLEHLARQAHAGPPVFDGQTREGDPACLVADCSKAERALGWRPRVGWQDGVGQYAEWFAAAQTDVAGGQVTASLAAAVSTGFSSGVGGAGAPR